MGDVTIGLATEADITEYLGIRNDVAAWMVSTGNVQWKPGELTEDGFGSVTLFEKTL